MSSEFVEMRQNWNETGSQTESQTCEVSSWCAHAKIKDTESILDLDDSISFHTPDFGVWWNPATKVANHLALWEVLFCYVKCSMTKPIFSVGSIDTYCVICIWGYIVVGKVNKKWRLFLGKHGKSQGGTNQICFCFLYILVTCNTISAFT